MMKNAAAAHADIKRYVVTVCAMVTLSVQAKSREQATDDAAEMSGFLPQEITSISIVSETA